MLRLLVALDFSECSQLALTTALSVAERAGPTEIIAFTVLAPHPDEAKALGDLERAVDQLRHMVDTVHTERAERAQHAAHPGSHGQPGSHGHPGHALPPGVQIRYAAAHGAPAHEIAAHAAAHHVDAIVLGTHGRTGLRRMVLGSVAETVVRTAPCSVLTVKPSHPHPYPHPTGHRH